MKNLLLYSDLGTNAIRIKKVKSDNIEELQNESYIYTTEHNATKDELIAIQIDKPLFKYKEKMKELLDKYFNDFRIKKKHSSVNADVIICMNTKQGQRSNPQNFVKDSKGYRILTEGELFSLQGFKREYGKLLRKAGITLSQIGYMCGNSITVNVVEKIFKNLLPKKYYNAIPIF